MSFANFIPAVWAAAVQEPYEKALVFAGPDTVDREYEGSIGLYGGSVVINSISDPTIGTYVPGSTVITPEQLNPASQELKVDQMHYFSFEVDDVDRRQAAGGASVMSTKIRRAGYLMKDVVDLYVAALYAGAATANQITTTTINTAALALTGLSDLGVKLDEANVQQEGRFAILPPWYHGLLRQSTQFTALGGKPGEEALLNGLVGYCEGFAIKVSNNVTNTTGDDYRVCAGVQTAINMAEQINKVEPFRPESSFSDAVKGLLVYGAKLTDPTGIATLIASKT